MQSAMQSINRLAQKELQSEWVALGGKIHTKVINGEPGASATGVHKCLLGHVLRSLTFPASRLSEAITPRSGGRSMPARFSLAVLASCFSFMVCRLSFSSRSP